MSFDRSTHRMTVKFGGHNYVSPMSSASPCHYYYSRYLVWFNWTPKYWATAFRHNIESRQSHVNTYLGYHSRQWHTDHSRSRWRGKTSGQKELGEKICFYCAKIINMSAIDSDIVTKYRLVWCFVWCFQSTIATLWV